MHNYHVQVQTINCNLLTNERKLCMDKREEESSADHLYDRRLKGTFITVLGIGVIIFISWLAMFLYYIATV